MDYILERGTEGSTSYISLAEPVEGREMYMLSSFFFFPPEEIPSLCVWYMHALWSCRSVDGIKSWPFDFFTLYICRGVSGMRREESDRLLQNTMGHVEVKTEEGLISELAASTFLSIPLCLGVLPHGVPLQCLWTSQSWCCAHSRYSSNIC